MNEQIKKLEEKITGLESKINDLSGAFYKNNFTSSQVFNKDCTFSSRLRVPIYDAAPSVAEVGDIICVSAQLYICTDNSPVTFELVGSQT